MIKVVVFDFDGTLVDSNDAKQDCLLATVRAQDGGEDALAEAVAIGGNRYKVFAEVARRLSRGEQFDGLARQLAANYTRCCALAILSAAERRGARCVLTTLRRRGLSLWVNSGTPIIDLCELVRRRGLLPHFRGVLGSPSSKADNLRRIMRIEGVSHRQILHIGDSPDDYVAAREAGTWFVAIDNERRIADPVRFAIKDLRRLPSIIERLHPLGRSLSLAECYR
jgi:phosphoglycolate phosphatase-like HAD superfamily hydrolase